MMENLQDIEREISAHKRNLERNVAELQDRVTDAADWRKQYEKNTLLSMCCAFGGGLLVSALLTPGKISHTYLPAGEAASAAPGPLNQIWTGIVSAGASLAAEKVREVVDGVVPGFGEHFDRARGLKS